MDESSSLEKACTAVALCVAALCPTTRVASAAAAVAEGTPTWGVLQSWSRGGARTTGKACCVPYWRAAEVLVVVGGGVVHIE